MLRRVAYSSWFVFILACSNSGTNSNPPANPPAETGVKDATADAPGDGPIFVPLDASHVDSFNQSCKSIDDCDPNFVNSSTYTSLCSNDFFSGGTTSPTAVCQSLYCEGPKNADEVKLCEGNRGLCLVLGKNSAGKDVTGCLSLCTFDDSTNAASGCPGKNACNFYRSTIEGGKVKGYGYCQGGCKKDSDCGKAPNAESNDLCQVEDGVCVSADYYTSYASKLGDLCTLPPAAKPGEEPAPLPCNCFGAVRAKAATGGNPAQPERKGYCTAYCITGDSDSQCANGYVCDPRLPTKNEKTGATLFTQVPKGIAGECLKRCGSPSDCLAGFDCRVGTSSGEKLCLPPLPAATDGGIPDSMPDSTSDSAPDVSSDSAPDVSSDSLPDASDSAVADSVTNG